MTGVGEHYYELHAGRRGHAAADEAMLRAVTFIRKLGERAHFSQDEHGTRIMLERVPQGPHAMDCAVGRLTKRRLEHHAPGHPRRGRAASSRPSLRSQKSRDLEILRFPSPHNKLSSMEVKTVKGSVSIH